MGVDQYASDLDDIILWHCAQHDSMVAVSNVVTNSQHTAGHVSCSQNSKRMLTMKYALCQQRSACKSAKWATLQQAAAVQPCPAPEAPSDGPGLAVFPDSQLPELIHLPLDLSSLTADAAEWAAIGMDAEAGRAWDQVCCAYQHGCC